MTAEIKHGDCLAILAEMPDASIDAIVTDPPYGLAFMGKRWDYDVPAVEVWRECLRVLKPGGHLLAFAGTRTQHRMAVRIEDAGFEIRDMIAWVYGSGFPKSLDVSKAIDKAAGAEREVVGPNKWAERGGLVQANTYGTPSRPEDTAPATPEAQQWSGWGTALKPAMEPITMARKPLVGTVAANVLEHGTGALNVDGGRVGTFGGGTRCDNRDENGKCQGHGNAGRSTSGETFHGPDTQGGRFPANLIHDGSDEVVELFPQTSPSPKTTKPKNSNAPQTTNAYGAYSDTGRVINGHGDSGSAARFFYCAKASKADRSEKNRHPTVKPTDLMRYLCRLVTPPGGVVLDPFCGSGSTGKAAVLEGFNFIGIEREAEYVEIARARIAAAVTSRGLF